VEGPSAATGQPSQIDPSRKTDPSPSHPSPSRETALTPSTSSETHLSPMDMEIFDSIGFVGAVPYVPSNGYMETKEERLKEELRELKRLGRAAKASKVPPTHPSATLPLPPCPPYVLSPKALEIQEQLRQECAASILASMFILFDYLALY
jgi:hypothetical protein